MADSEWEPEPVRGGVTLAEGITNVGLLGLAVLAATFLVVVAPTRTCGATRSAQLQWQQRQQQTEAAVGAAENAAEAERGPAAAGQDPAGAEQGPAGAKQQPAEQAGHDATQVQR